MVRALVNTCDVGRGDRRRAREFVEARQQVFAARAVKLYPLIYGLSTGKYVRAVERDVSTITVDNLAFLPRKIG